MHVSRCVLLLTILMSPSAQATDEPLAAPAAHDDRAALADVKQLSFVAAIMSLGYVFWICGGMEMLRAFWDSAHEVSPAAAEQHDEATMRLGHEGELGRLWQQAGLLR